MLCARMRSSDTIPNWHAAGFQKRGLRGKHIGVPFTRRGLFHLGNSERFDRLVRACAPLRAWAYARARRYVAGPTLADAITVTRPLVHDGLAASIDYLGWYVEDRRAIAAAVAEYGRLCEALRGLRADVHVSLDLTHFGLRSSIRDCCARVGEIADVLPVGALIQLGGEAARDADRVLAATLALARDGLPVMATLQANLRRAAADAERLAERRIPVRLVKGAYVEGRTDAYGWGARTDAAFEALARRLAEVGVPLALATHDPPLLTRLLYVIPDASVEVLLGVREKETQALAARHRMRVYVPYGENWFRYYVHRLAEARGA